MKSYLFLIFFILSSIYAYKDYLHVGEELNYDIKVLGIRVGKQDTKIIAK